MALRRHLLAATGRWQRYRITNTSLFTFWAEDISVDDLHDHIYVGGNAGTGVGGMMRFDGQRCARCGSENTYLVATPNERGETFYLCSDTDWCGRRQ